jgi:enamine deaminase RidA (YjgF/YER057c/UK114 family)
MVTISFIVWYYWQPIENSPPASQLMPESLPVTAPTSPNNPPAPATLLIQSVTAPPPPEAPVVNTGDVEPPLPDANVSQSLQTQQIEQWLKNCKKQLEARNLTTAKGGGETAVVCYRKVLAADENNIAAKEGMAMIEDFYGDWAKNALKKKQLQKARTSVRTLAEINPNSPRLKELQQQLATVK